MIRFRPFRNDDAPALAKLWNLALPIEHVFRPLNGHQFDSLVVDRIVFDRLGLILAVDSERGPLGFVHAGFGPVDLAGTSQALDHSFGTVAMLCVDSRTADHSISQELLRRAIQYLRERDCRVIYAGGQSPLNPFYWGLYGGSEFGGILSGHQYFQEAVELAGFERVAGTVILELELAAGEVRHPSIFLTRRSFQVQVEEDALPSNWWDGVSLRGLHPNHYRVVAKAGGASVGEAWTFEMGGEHPSLDRLMLRGLFHFHVEPSHRRRGIGRLLLAECLKHARAQRVDRFCVQTNIVNLPARALYENAGFSQRSESFLYRLKGGGDGDFRTGHPLIVHP